MSATTISSAAATKVEAVVRLNELPLGLSDVRSNSPMDSQNQHKATSDISHGVSFLFSLGNVDKPAQTEYEVRVGEVSFKFLEVPAARIGSAIVSHPLSCMGMTRGLYCNWDGGMGLIVLLIVL